MGNCFVIQPFDGGVFDKRYDSVFAPAIEAAGVQPYRVDRDPSVSIPIQDIENGIRDSIICFADITTDNPNVWFELGFALAIPKEVVLVCSNERATKYPFDIQHRSIIQYDTGAPQDYSELQEKITERIKAILNKAEKIDHIVRQSVVKDTEGLNQHEVVALATLLQNSFLSNDYVYGYQIRNDMTAAGFTDIAVAIALRTLEKKGMIETNTDIDEDGIPYAIYKITEMGEQWLIKHQDMLTLKKVDPEGEFPF